MTDVFISYSRRDKVFTQKLYEALKAANREVWADWDSIPASSDWDAEIKEGIEKTESVLFLLSPEWIKSNECRKELNHAVTMGKRLFPILYINVDPADVPPELAKINWVYMRDTDDFDKAFQTLCSAMDTDLEWVKSHTRIQVRALEWDKKNRDNSFALHGKDLADGEQFIAGAAHKSPEPTPLQGEYVLASRKDANRRQRLTLTGVTIALIISVALGIAAVFQRQAAVANAQEAIKQQGIAEINAQEAIKQKSIAQDNEKIAVANEQEAKRQAKISHSGELSAQSVLIREKNLQLALLLGIESYRSFVTVQSFRTLLENAQTNPSISKFLSGRNSATLAFSPDGKTLASANFDNTLILFDVATGQPISQPLNNDAGLLFTPGGKALQGRGLEFSPDGKTLASSGGLSIRLWNVVTRQPIGQPLTVHQGYINFLTFSPDGKTIASGGCSNEENGSCTQGEIFLWDVTKGKPIGQPLISAEEVERVAFNSLDNGKTIMSSSHSYRDGRETATITMWDLGSEKPIGKPFTITNAYKVVVSPDGKTLVSLDTNSAITLWDVLSRKPISQPFKGNLDVSASTFSPDGKILALGLYDGTIILLDTETGQPIGQTLTGYLYGFYCLAFSSDGKTLAAGISSTTAIVSNDFRGIVLSDITNNQPISQPILGEPDWLISQADPSISPDGKIRAEINYDNNTILLRDVTTGELIGYPLQPTFNSYGCCFLSPAFSPDGKTLAAGNVAGSSVFLWDIPTRQFIGELLAGNRVPGDRVDNLIFNPDGKTLAAKFAFGGDQFLWDLDPQSWIEKSCQRVGRNFTRAEWEKYNFAEPYRKTCEQYPLEAEITSTPTIVP